MAEQVLFRPASKKQEMFIQSTAFRTVYGGSAGGGKTYMGLMRFLLYVNDPRFIGFVLRKNATDLKGAGGAFDEALEMFKKYDPKMTHTKQPMEIKFSNGAKIFFTGLNDEKGMKSLQGKQISGLMLDEATHFTEEEITWAESRLRTKANMVPNIWLTCNPDMDSVIFTWINDFYLYPKNTIIDGEDVGGRANPDKDGVVRYYLKVGNDTKWADDPQKLIDEHGHKFPKDKKTGETTARPKSFTFISATCLDNPPLLEANPDYVSTLAALPRITRERLLYGNWLAREEGAGYFKRDWCEIIYKLPDNIKRRGRAWDIAATLKTEGNPDPDYTAGVQLSKTSDGYYIIENVKRDRKRIMEVLEWIGNVALEDYEYSDLPVETYIPQDPAASGKYTSQQWVNTLATRGVSAKRIPVATTKSKLTRFLPFAAVAEAGLVKVLSDRDLPEEEKWNDMFFDELESFTGERSRLHDDMVDATSDIFSKMASNKELPNLSAKAIRM